MEEPLPLAGRMVVLTRAAERASGLAARLRAFGAELIIYPTIAYAAPERPDLFAAALGRLAAGAYDWLLLTSRVAVEAVAAGLPAPLPPACRLAAVGAATARACRDLLGRAPEVVPERFIAEGLADALGDLAGARVLLPNADIARPVLEQRLRTGGAAVDRVVAYRTVPAPDNGLDMAGLLAAGRTDVISFTSASTARYFAQKVGPAGLAHARRAAIACIGPATAAACRELGLEPALVADPSTEESLAAAIAAYFGAVRLSNRQDQQERSQ